MCKVSRDVVVRPLAESSLQRDIAQLEAAGEDQQPDDPVHGAAGADACRQVAGEPGGGEGEHGDGQRELHRLDPDVGAAQHPVVEAPGDSHRQQQRQQQRAVDREPRLARMQFGSEPQRRARAQARSGWRGVRVKVAMARSPVDGMRGRVRRRSDVARCDAGSRDWRPLLRRERTSLDQRECQQAGGSEHERQRQQRQHERDAARRARRPARRSRHRRRGRTQGSAASRPAAAPAPRTGAAPRPASRSHRRPSPWLANSSDVDRREQQRHERSRRPVAPAASSGHPAARPPMPARTAWRSRWRPRRGSRDR